MRTIADDTFNKNAKRLLDRQRRRTSKFALLCDPEKGEACRKHDAYVRSIWRSMRASKRKTKPERRRTGADTRREAKQATTFGGLPDFTTGSGV